MTEALRASPKLRLLRVFNVIGAVFNYCVANFGRLFVFAWLAGALYSLSLELVKVLPSALGLEWPTREPTLRPFDLQSLATPFFASPWEAMAWFFVLLAMSDPNSRRGVVVIPPRTLSWLRFELNAAIGIAAAMFCALSLFAELTTAVRVQIWTALFPDGQSSGTTAPVFWAYVLELLRLTVMAVVYAWCLPLIGQVLRTGSLQLERTQYALRGNRLRLFAVFLLLSIGFELISIGAGQAATAITSEVILVAFYFPFQMLLIVVTAVTVGIVLNALDERPAQTAAAQPAAPSFLTASAAPLPRPGDSPPSSG